MARSDGARTSVTTSPGNPWAPRQPPLRSRVRGMHLARSIRWGVFWTGALIVVTASGCGSGPSESKTTVTPTPANQTAVAPASSPPGTALASCFTVTAPAGWTSQPAPQCGLALAGPKGAGVSISVDTEPIDAATLHELIAEKYSDVIVSEEAINGERVLVGTGAVPGALYIVVQARSATSSKAGYYAQGLTPDAAQIDEIKSILATLRTTPGK